MPAKRIIPCLLLLENGLVKTMRFAKPSYVGDPINVVRIFNEKEVDEIVIFDILATRLGRRPRHELLEQIVSEAFMPVCYGGAVRGVEDARALLAIGIEKLAVNSIALTDLDAVRALSDRFGAQCVMGVIDVRRDLFGGLRVHSHAGLPIPEKDPVRWAEQLERAGVGEIMVQAVDRDGTRGGLDHALAREFAGRIAVPLVLAGGARDATDMIGAFQSADLSGVAAGAQFVWYGPHRAVLVNYLSPDEIRAIAKAAP